MGLTKFIYFTLLGWKIEGGFDPTIKKSVLIVAPHTSSMDFLLSVLVRRILKLQINFVGKKSYLVLLGDGILDGWVERL